MTSGQNSEESVLLPVVEPRWDAARTERALGAVRTRLQTRRRRRTAAVACTGVATLALGVWGLLRSHGAEIAQREATQTAQTLIADATQMGRTVHFYDGSSVKLESQESDLNVREVSETKVEVELRRGAGRFSVAPKPTRSFSVRSGAVTVTVVGTEFRVHSLGATTAVEVEHGVVRVSWAAESALLHAGERGVFPPPSALPTLPQPPGSAAAVDVPTPTETSSVQAVQKPKTEEFRLLAKRRDYNAAYEILVSTPSAVGASSADLLLAADVARLSGHPAEAVPYLERLLATRPESSEAPLAAFTLGRTLMGLGQSANAIAAFARARSLAPNGPLAEDALVRQIEAASRSGNRELAKQLAEQYERSYPSGRKLEIVRGYTGQKK